MMKATGQVHASAALLRWKSDL